MEEGVPRAIHEVAEAQVLAWLIARGAPVRTGVLTRTAMVVGM
jgi:hypothetical protein